jgi:2,4'-dihydroxyacetophenone dioxygenase
MEHVNNLIADVVERAIPDDERLWVPQAPQVWFRPLLLDTVTGQWVNVLRVRRSGILSRHLHPAPVYGYVLKGSWRYLEHEWEAVEGAFVFEPPGEVHTLVVDGVVQEMITLFHVCGCLVYLDSENRPLFTEDVHSKIDKARRHYRSVGLGEDWVRRYIR